MVLSVPLEVLALDKKVCPWPLPSSGQALVAPEPGSSLTRLWAAHLFKDLESSWCPEMVYQCSNGHRCVTAANGGS